MRLLSLLAIPISTCVGFAPTTTITPTTTTTATRWIRPSSSTLRSSRGGGGIDEDDDESSRMPRKSRLEGMQRRPSPSDVAIIDDMIDKLGNAKPYELPNAVSRALRVVSSPQFFLRIAERADAAAISDPTERERLSALADNLVNTIRAVVSVAEDGLNDRARDVERVVKAASEPESGEFLVPLSGDRILAMRAEMMDLEPEDLNEGFLSTIDSWMNKAHQVRPGLPRRPATCDVHLIVFLSGGGSVRARDGAFPPLVFIIV